MSSLRVESKDLPGADLAGSGLAAVSRAAIHFPWLTELRFFAALMVVICHVSQIRQWEGIGPHSSDIMHNVGTNGVRVFFVLSGFLITHLLISERANTGTIDIGKFYLRRALRIWPVYYATLFVAFLIPASLIVCKPISQIAVLCDYRFHDFGSKVTLFLVMLPNLASLLFPPLVGAAQTWSIGVEEQFYLIWPLLMKRFGKNPLLILLGVITAKILLVMLLAAVSNSTGLADSLRSKVQIVANFLNFFEIESMAVGGLAAYMLMRHRMLLLKCTSSLPARLLLVLVVPFCFTLHPTQLVPILLCDVAYATMLLCLTLSNLILPELIWAPLKYFGKISYSVYMVHPIVIMIVAKCLFSLKLHMNNSLVIALLYSLSLALTLSAAALVYELYEKKFLVFKSRFAIMQSST